VVSSGTQFHSVISSELFPLEDVRPFHLSSNSMEAAVNSPQPPAALDTGPGQGRIFCLVLITGECLVPGVCRWSLHGGVAVLCLLLHFLLRRGSLRRDVHICKSLSPIISTPDRKFSCPCLSSISKGQEAS
jgi:hypothetical protein